MKKIRATRKPADTRSRIDARSRLALGLSDALMGPAYRNGPARAVHAQYALLASQDIRLAILQA
ncbi:hypothetical protein IAG25_33090 [Caballeronia sp. EK]|uniref:hypothetical protein n=1 Tax=Caballeronia sp. EK TaxID=2767469 RepID=UPI001655124A|nr:hypothetical protein [Caballeronia sp. EK]MBC8641663.1 hypothetical protein [Caballeronia sp. EK]